MDTNTLNQKLPYDDAMRIEESLEEEYNRMYKLSQNGEITQHQWFEFCSDVLAKILEENKDVLIRLKNR